VSEALILLTLVTPLAFALLIGLVPSSRQILMQLSPVAAAPGLALALAVQPGEAFFVPWLLLDTSFMLDEAGRIFMLFTSILWLIAYVFAIAYMAQDPLRHRFFLYFLLVTSGNFGVILAGDVASFYTSFALMTFAAYGFIVHGQTSFAFRAGRVYIALAVVGEFMLLSGLLIAAFAAGSFVLVDIPGALAGHQWQDLAVGLLLAGFGVKVGALPLHVWLPLAHPAAPTPASAVLSGALIKAGVFGWLRFLPLGEVAMPEWGLICVGAGLGAAFYGVTIGLTQDQPKTNLAYSSISQMGILTFGLGLTLAEPALAPLSLTILPVYALHHGLAKASLFLATGLLDAIDGRRTRLWLLRGGLFLGTASMAGLVLTSGFFGKEAMKELASQSPRAWYPVVAVVFPFTQTATTLLMLRLWQLMVPSPSQFSRSPLLWWSWLACLGCVAFLLWAAALLYDLAAVRALVISPASVWSSTWPILTGVALFVASTRLPLRTAASVPPGDLLILLEATWARTRHVVTKWLAPVFAEYLDYSWQGWLSVSTRVAAVELEALENRLASWRIAGVFLLLSLVLLVGTLSLR
jgi:formate hydrogenlyase subunit 3/multisubunit Na+/H+ antiporter MnhD subunit